MKPQRIIDILAVISAGLITLAIVSLITGCHTRKVTQAHSSEVTTETATGHRTDKTDMVAFWSMFGRYLTSSDSVATELSADSIVTSSGTIIYAPAVKRTDYGQKSVAETDCSSSTKINTGTTEASAAVSDRATEVTSVQQSETTAITEPPNITVIIIVAIIGAVLPHPPYCFG